MNILTHTLGFYPALAWGGPVKVVYQNSKELIRRGHQVTVYCSNLMSKGQKIYPRTCEKDVDGIRVVYFDALNLSWWPGTLGPNWLPEMRDYLRREIHRYDVVHQVGYRSLVALASAMVARSAGVPIVMQPQGSLPAIVNIRLLKRLYDVLLGRMELKGISALAALQETERQQALNCGVPADRIEIIPNGIDPDAVPCLSEPGSFRRKFGLASDRPLILFLGRINRIKGTDMLLRAISKLNIPEFQLALAGPDDGQLSEVKILIDELALNDRVFLLGLVSDSDKSAAFQDADLYVLPSRYDAYPTTIMESCLAGTPMVVTDRCAMASILKDRVADVVPFDPDAFAGAIHRLLTDKERYEFFRQNCPKIVADTFSIRAVVDRLEALFVRVSTEKKQKSANKA